MGVQSRLQPQQQLLHCTFPPTTPLPRPSWLWCPELSLGTLQLHWEGLPCKTQREAASPSPNGSDLPGTASYSLELLHKCTMVSYILPEAFENGADVVADCKLVVELASGSSVFHICRREEIPGFPTRIHWQHTSPYCLQCDELQAPRETSRDETQFPLRSLHLNSH